MGGGLEGGCVRRFKGGSGKGVERGFKGSFEGVLGGFVGVGWRGL